MATKVCEICGKEFESNYPNAKYCSEKCKKVGNSRASDERYWKNKMGKKKKCPICGKAIPRNRFKYCSELCAYKARFEKTERHNKIRPKKKNETLCWTCQNACGGCSWSRNLEPVEGWEAKPTRLNIYISEGNEGLDCSYRVINCPQYVPDEPRGVKM